ncbi:hypothetical protein Q7S_25776 (plasmid) [Rahnella aquatilis HX2]|nr:hypothetical protein Q7S_25776 [Rahnella aquatilis HX2]
MNIYHYTDLNAVHSILDTHKIRMTDIRFLNDKTEYRQGLELLEEASHEIFHKKTMYSKEFVETVEKWFPRVFKELLDMEYANEMFYVASFSLSSDTLSQWRSYGMFAVILDHDQIWKDIDKIDLRIKYKGRTKIYFLECYYVNEKHKALGKAKALLHSKVLGLLNDFWLYDDPNKHNLDLYTDLKERVSMVATIFKHSCFAEEKEVRLVISDKTVSKKILFRVKNNLLIPYYEYALSPEIFTGVRIGPLENQELTTQSLRIYAAHRQEKLGRKQYPLVIEKSEIPYRTL